MRGEIRQLQKALSITAVYVTHDQEEAMAISDHIAVMNEGKIVQIGTAEELYLQPGSPFVAQFIGRINTLPARVKAVTAGQVQLEIFGRPLVITTPTGGVTAGETISVFIRPECVELTEGTGEETWIGQVAEKTFLGEKVEYLLDLDGHRLSATSYDPLRHGTYALHQQVGIRFNPDTVNILKKGESGER